MFIMKKLIVMADYISGLFFPEGSIDPEQLGASEDLCARFNAWLVRYREYDDAPPDFDRQKYNETGRAFAYEIQQLVSGKYSVTYRFLSPADSPTAECEWVEEQLLPKASVVSTVAGKFQGGQADTRMQRAFQIRHFKI